MLTSRGFSKHSYTSLQATHSLLIPWGGNCGKSYVEPIFIEKLLISKTFFKSITKISASFLWLLNHISILSTEPLPPPRGQYGDTCHLQSGYGAQHYCPCRWKPLLVNILNDESRSIALLIFILFGVQYVGGLTLVSISGVMGWDKKGGWMGSISWL